MPSQTFYNLSEEKRSRIYQAALEVFSSMPYEKVSIQAVVDKAGIPRGSFYQYFNDIEDLYAYCTISYRSRLSHVFDGENLEFFWQRLYTRTSVGLQKEQLAQLIRQSLDETEYRFATNESYPPHHVRLRIFLENGLHFYYPRLYAQLLADGFPAQKTEKRLLAYLLSLWDFFIVVYGENTETSEASALNIIADLYLSLLRLYQEGRLLTYGAEMPAPQMPESAASTPAEKLQAKLCALRLTSLRLITPQGLYISVSLPQDSWTVCAGDASESAVSVVLAEDSLDGTLPMSLSACANHTKGADGCSGAVATENTLTITAGGKVRLTACGAVHELTSASLAIIGTRAGGGKVCIMDEGQLAI